MSRRSDRMTAIFQMSVPQRPCMNHVWPDLQSYCDGRSGPGGKPSGVIKQGLIRTNLDKHRRKVSEISVERETRGSFLSMPAGT